MVQGAWLYSLEGRAGLRQGAGNQLVHYTAGANIPEAGEGEHNHRASPSTVWPAREQGRGNGQDRAWSPADQGSQGSEV